MPWTDWLWQRSRPPPPPPSKDDLSPTLSQSLPLDDDTLSSLSSSPAITILLPSLLLTTTSLLGIRFYKRNLRRYATTPFIPPRVFRSSRSLYGYVPSVGDGDNFRLFHTPGGKLAGWGLLPFRRHHLSAKKLETIHVRIAGVDAPELAHFGRPAQPFGAEALTFLRALVLHRNVRVYLYRRDQYERVVGTAWVAAPPGRVVRGLAGLPVALRVLLGPVELVLRVVGWGWRAATGRRRVDVGLAMIREGMATVYEAKFGSEFGGPEKEKEYREAEREAKERKKGMWGGAKSELEKDTQAEQGWWSWITGGGGGGGTNKLESPREYKNRMKEMEEGKAGEKAKK